MVFYLGCEFEENLEFGRFGRFGQFWTIFEPFFNFENSYLWNGALKTQIILDFIYSYGILHGI